MRQCCEKSDKIWPTFCWMLLIWLVTTLWIKVKFLCNLDVVIYLVSFPAQSALHRSLEADWKSSLPALSRLCSRPRSGWYHQTNDTFFKHLMALPSPSIPLQIPAQCMTAIAIANCPGQKPDVCVCLLLSVSLNKPLSSSHTCHICHTLSTC